MKLRFAALAAALVVSSVGCTAINSCSTCGDTPCHVATSQRAPRATPLFGRCPSSHGILDKLGWTQKGCCECVGDGCGGGCGLFGSGDCGGCQGGACGCGPDGCLQHGLHALLDCNGCNGCNSCGDQNYNFTPGPPVGQVAYPYYTTRGPRDFLMCNPPSIGPR